MILLKHDLIMKTLQWLLTSLWINTQILPLTLKALYDLGCSLCFLPLINFAPATLAVSGLCGIESHLRVYTPAVPSVWNICSDMESISFATFLVYHFFSPLALKESNSKNETTKQLKLICDYALLNAHHAFSKLLIFFFLDKRRKEWRIKQLKND